MYRLYEMNVVYPFKNGMRLLCLRESFGKDIYLPSTRFRILLVNSHILTIPSIMCFWVFSTKHFLGVAQVGNINLCVIFLFQLHSPHRENEVSTLKFIIIVITHDCTVPNQSELDNRCCTRKKRQIVSSTVIRSIAISQNCITVVSALD